MSEAEAVTKDTDTQPYYWYVFHVKSGFEKRVVEDLTRFVAVHGFGSHRVEPFCPETEVYYRTAQGKRPGKCYRMRPLFAGYVFVETTMPASMFLTEFGSYIYSSHEIIRILKSGASKNIALPDDERMRLEYLLKDKRCVEHSIGFIVGDKITITAGSLKGMEGLIVYINRHNRYADIKLNMFGGEINARVALEIVEKN